MKKLAFFDTRPYDRPYFEKYAKNYEITYFEEKLNHHTAKITEGFDGVCAFVNSDINRLAVERMRMCGVRILAMRCAGFSNVDIRAAKETGLCVVRVPAYSPHAVAEHTLALLLALNRRIYRAYIRTRDFNFNISGLCGIDLYGKTAGIIGTGKIGRTFISLCRGLGMNILAYDPQPAPDAVFAYVPLETLLKESHIISLHCPLTESSYHMLNADTFSIMRDDAFLLNTSRGALIDSDDLLAVLTAGKLRGAALDVYEEEADFFYEDLSDKTRRDNTLALLMSRPNVLITSHQAFLTEEALESIAKVTIHNLDSFFAGATPQNAIV